MSERVRRQSGRAWPEEERPGGRQPDGTFAPGNRVGKHFRKGRSGNPAGRPKSAMLSDALRRRLGEVDEKDPEERTHAEVIADRLIAKAKEGDVPAIREIGDRVEGKAQQRVTLSRDVREIYERTVTEIMESSGCTREEAIRTLAIYKPDAVSLLVN